MIGRDYKPFAAENYYHVYNRGNNKQAVFLDAEDYGFFLSRLGEALGRRVPSADCRGDTSARYVRKKLPAGAFSLICYCLMPNHFHFLLRQNSEISTGLLIQKVCTGYSIYFNKKYSHVGHIWQGEFKAILIADDSYLLWLSAYIHLNPVLAQLVARPEDYTWSSLGDFAGAGSKLACENDIVVNQFKSRADYLKYVFGNYVSIKEHHSARYLMDD